MWSHRAWIVWSESVEHLEIERPNLVKLSTAEKPSGWHERPNMIYLPRKSWSVGWYFELWPGSGRQGSYSCCFGNF